MSRPIWNDEAERKRDERIATEYVTNRQMPPWCVKLTNEDRRALRLTASTLLCAAFGLEIEEEPNTGGTEAV